MLAEFLRTVMVTLRKMTSRKEKIQYLRGLMSSDIESFRYLERLPLVIDASIIHEANTGKSCDVEYDIAVFGNDTICGQLTVAGAVVADLNVRREWFGVFKEAVERLGIRIELSSARSLSERIPF